MKPAANVAAFLLFGIFQFAAWNHFFRFQEMPAPPEGSAPALFMGAMVPTGYFTFVKVLEILGSLLTLVPATRSLGLLIVGPIVVNILCFHGFLLGGAGLFPLPLVVSLCSAFLLWTERGRFRHLFPIPPAP
ncbi:hypothetical protein OVA24_13345 [Luteolibacter sp. SL250]|uniref:hypothetical protein n=1 Tax=Luteolibacter sp. SL250 TaxID=2995170 RepID=UPI00226F972F|nr:hypothetical protein [Luteolibacter sp. SL250]WAC18223.1 hypothetical protein OVA24_13345 [Luteolibacter sp. SL250]